MKASRVVALLHELSTTGAPRLTLDILEAVYAEASVRIVSWEGGPLFDVARRIGPTSVLQHAHLVRGWAGVSRRIRAAEQAVRLGRWNPELVYVSSVLALPLVRMLRLRNAPVVLHVHELGSALEWFERSHPGLILSIPDRYVAVSPAVAHDLVRMGVPLEAVSVVPPYVLASVPEVLPASTRGDQPMLVVGGAGNPSWTKGIDVWLLAAREAVDRMGVDRLRFVWLGWRDNQEGLQFRTMVSRLGLDAVVELVPETDRPYDQFARFDIFAMTSWEESASLVVLEAMALAIPVICFAPTGGPAEEVGEAGVVIPAISPHGMADAIVDLAQSAQKRRVIGSAGAERVREHFSREKSLAKLTRVFDAALA
jgi:glycosyltransferase involved in cell wall biosynthesis